MNFIKINCNKISQIQSSYLGCQSHGDIFGFWYFCDNLCITQSSSQTVKPYFHPVQVSALVLGKPLRFYKYHVGLHNCADFHHFCNYSFNQSTSFTKINYNKRSQIQSSYLGCQSHGNIFGFGFHVIVLLNLCITQSSSQPLKLYTHPNGCRLWFYAKHQGFVTITLDYIFAQITKP